MSTSPATCRNSVFLSETSLSYISSWLKKKRNKKQTNTNVTCLLSWTYSLFKSVFTQLCESLSVDLVWHGQVSWNHFQSLYFCLKASLFKSKESVGTLLYWGLGPVWGSTVGIKLSILRYSEGIDQQRTLALFVSPGDSNVNMIFLAPSPGYSVSFSICFTNKNGIY